MTDWQQVANEMYMYAVGLVVARQHDEEGAMEAAARVRAVFDGCIKANTYPPIEDPEVPSGGPD